MKNGGIDIINWLLRIFNRCMGSGVVPEYWKAACIVAVYKGKGERRDCVNYGGIGILSIPGKLYGRVLISRVIENTKEQSAEEQGGFRSSRGCIEQIFVLKQLVGEYRVKRKELHVPLMDQEKKKCLWTAPQKNMVGPPRSVPYKAHQEAPDHSLNKKFFVVNTRMRKGVEEPQ